VEEEILMVAMTAMFCGTALLWKLINVFAGRRMGLADRQRHEAELVALREEIARMKLWASDMMLTFDATLQQYQSRLQSVERRALSEAAPHSRVAERESQEVAARV
jgi:hypothetical protein